MEPSPSSRSLPAPAWPDAAPPPEAAWPLIGRDELVAELASGLVAGKPRAIALGGLGGVGKTRLAAEVARAAAGALAGRVAWIEVAGTAREVGLGPAIAGGLGLSGIEAAAMADALAEALGTEPVLLVLDAAEVALHDLALVDRLLARAPALRLLITSRIAIDRPGIAAIAIDGLAVPDPADDAAAIAASPAVRLLVDRAERAGAEVAITAGTCGSIARLVARLDGLPLALELAAPLLRVLPPHRLLDRTDTRLDAVRSTIDWSHEQLEPDDRRLYRRLAVFGVPFRARHVRTFAERALSHGLSPLGPDVAGGLERLVAAGLIRARPDPDLPDPATGPDDPRGAEPEGLSDRE